ncbi:hypothetical protein HY383_00825 [Candidatus Daviesbacteria bacterium]|nr:hypothetical protein [Candidatus Daviesbacteria bacterium]
MKYFYTHLIESESIIIELDKLSLPPEQKKHLAHLVDSNIHHTILDAIFSELSDSDKRVFVQHLSQDDHQQTWKFLSDKINNIEDKIKKVAEDLKSELHTDIKKSFKQASRNKHSNK